VAGLFDCHWDLEIISVSVVVAWEISSVYLYSTMRGTRGKVSSYLGITGQLQKGVVVKSEVQTQTQRCVYIYKAEVEAAGLPIPAIRRDMDV